MVPQDSFADIIDVLETIWKQSGDNGKFALVFDNLSDRVISIGLEKTVQEPEGNAGNSGREKGDEPFPSAWRNAGSERR